MSDNESFVSVESESNTHEKQVEKYPQDAKYLDNFLDFNIDYLAEEEKINYIGPPILPRIDFYEIKNEKIQFFQDENFEESYHVLQNRTKEEIDTFYKLKKQLYYIAYKNHNNNINKNETSKIKTDKEIEKEKEKEKENVKRENDDDKNQSLKSKKSYDILNHEMLGTAIGSKIEDTYNDIKSGVNWIGNFFSNTDHTEEKKELCVFYSDLYFFNDTTIIRYLDTYKYNLMKTLNRIIKCILWRQMSVAYFNEDIDVQVTNEKEKIKEQKEEKSQINKKNSKRSIFVNPKHIKNSIIQTKIFRYGFDKKSRPILYIKIQEKLKIQENDLFLNLVYHVDMCMNSINYAKCYEKEKIGMYWNDHKFDESVLQLVVVVDCLKFDLNNMISVDCIKRIINCFNEFYTDVLYRIYIINVPSFFKKVWSLFNMFIDNNTLKKIIIVNKNNINMMYEHINEKMMKHFDRVDDKKCENLIIFPSSSLYYKYDEEQYHTLMIHLNSWVDKMISVNH